MKYEEFRREYHSGGLSRNVLDDDPFEQLQRWLEQAVKSVDLRDPTAMVLATIDPDGRPWQRIVLLKDLNQSGLVFYTNYNSRKAEAIAAEPRVSLLFPWNDVDRQVIVGGVAEKLSVKESTRYFLSRPRESQLAAWASQQSRPISARKLLLQQLGAMKKKFGDGQVPLPDFWGGYRVVPDSFEFWQGNEHRLHDRFAYNRLAGGSWVIEQLQP
jgi:pyridoxamine 5'-phosphate oxidase